MTWSLMEDDSFKWPKELDPESYKGVAGAGSLKDVLKKLDDAEKSFKGIDFPYAWVTSNPVSHLNWQNHALKFLGGPAKSLSSNLAAIKSAADKAKDDKAVSGKSKDAAVAIGKAAKEHLKYVEAAELQGQVEKINKLCGTAAAEEIKKKTGAVKKSCKALTASRHPAIVAGGEALKDIDKPKPKPKHKLKPKEEEEQKIAENEAEKERLAGLETIRAKLAEGCTAIVDLAEEATRVRKAKGMMITGLTESDYNTLARVRAALKRYASTDKSWTNKYNVSAMRGAVTSIRKNAEYFDQVVRKMKAK